MDRAFDIVNRHLENVAMHWRRQHGEATRRWWICQLEKGADVDAQGGEYGDARQAAERGAPKKVVEMQHKKAAHPTKRSSKRMCFA
jgi:hypothetical protein